MSHVEISSLIGTTAAPSHVEISKLVGVATPIVTLEPSHVEISYLVGVATNPSSGIYFMENGVMREADVFITVP